MFMLSVLFEIKNSKTMKEKMTIVRCRVDKRSASTSSAKKLCGGCASLSTLRKTLVTLNIRNGIFFNTNIVESQIQTATCTNIERRQNHICPQAIMGKTLQGYRNRCPVAGRICENFGD